MSISQKPSPILLLIVSEMPIQFPMTTDFLNQQFSICGPLKQIYIFETGNTTKAFVQYQKLEDSITAQNKMQNKVLTPWGGKISISFSDITHEQFDQIINNNQQEEQKNQSLASLGLGEFALKDVFDDDGEKNDDQDAQKSLMKLIDDEYEKDAQNYSQMFEKVDDTGQKQFLQQYVETMKQRSQRELDSQITRNQSDPVHKYAFRNDEINDLIDDEQLPLKSSFLTTNSDSPVKKQFLQQQRNNEIELILSQQKSKQLLVTNLRNKELNSSIIYNLFSNFGNISQITFMKTSFQSLIMYTSNEFASIAKDLLNNLTFFNHQLRIFYSQDEMPSEKNNDSLIVPAQYYRFRMKKQIYINCPSPVLHLSNLNRSISLGRITQLFSNAGSVKRTKMLKNDLEKIMILVEMQSLKESMKAIGMFHNYELDGKKIQISFTKSSLNDN